MKIIVEIFGANRTKCGDCFYKVTPYDRNGWWCGIFNEQVLADPTGDYSKDYKKIKRCNSCKKTEIKEEV